MKVPLSSMVRNSTERVAANNNPADLNLFDIYEIHYMLSGWQIFPFIALAAATSGFERYT